MAGATRWAVFLDVDGTLVNDRGVVPDSARSAVASARGNGHLVFLCTGRSMVELWDSILEVGFDGVVASAGGHVELGGRILVEHTMAVEDVRDVVAYMDAHGIDYFLEANSGLYGSPGLHERLRRVLWGGVRDEDMLAELERALEPFVESVVVGSDLLRHDINKVSFLGDVPLEQVRAHFGERFDVIPGTVPLFGPNSGELAMPGVHKAAGIEALIEHLGIPRESTVAFGDAHNDLEMLRFVHVGVAMGNAHPDVRAVADRVTAGVDEDGLWQGFVALGLI